MEDKELIYKIQHGNKELLEILIEKYYDDPENDLSEDERKYQKSLDGTGVTREEYNKVLKKIEKINNNF